MLLEIDHLCAYYDDIQALFDVDFHINEKEIVSIVGSNAAGKSTTLRAISGILDGKTGRVVFDGREIGSLTSEQIVEAGIVQVPEGRQLFPGMTVLENLELGSFLPRAKSQRKQSLERVFSIFPRLLERKTQLAGTLSGGEQQMLAIGRALMSLPRLLMFDEPSLGLAPMLVREIFNIAKAVNQQGTTVLLVEQNVYHALGISDRAYVLENGRIVMEGPGRELLANDDIKKAYLGI